jgi:hypothetical protein
MTKLFLANGQTCTVEHTRNEIENRLCRWFEGVETPATILAKFEDGHKDWITINEISIADGGIVDFDELEP